MDFLYGSYFQWFELFQSAPDSHMETFLLSSLGEQEESETLYRKKSD
jgi:hypothetical protein